jgi:mRNA degradation ribonuclease J1/J2
MNRIYHQGEEFKLDQDIVAKFYFTNHSMSGSAIGIHTPNGNLFYSGDIKPGPITDTAIELASHEDYQYFLWENTNPKDTTKPSALTNEDYVADNISKVFKDPRNQGKLIIVMAPPNGLEKLKVICDIADEVGRNVVLSYQHAEIINHLRAERDRAPLDAEARGSIFLPEVGEDLGIYSKPMKRRRPWQNTIDEIAADKSVGVFKQNHLEQYAGETVLVVSPYENLMERIGGAVLDKPVFIYSSPYLYDHGARAHYAGNQSFLKKNGAKIYADFNVFGLNGGIIQSKGGPSNSYHWSGHATFEENMNLILKALGPKPEGKKIYFVHGESPANYANDADAWFKRKNIKGVKFVGYLNLYDHQSPLEHPGHIIKIG